MNKIQIHQFSPSAHDGDGITNGMLYFQKILRELGFTSNIYAQNHEKELSTKVIHYTEIDKENKNQILFIHYSIYYDFSIWIDSLDLRIHVIYHNITPFEFFEKDSILYNMCKLGKEYLPDLAPRFEGAIGDSILNTEELIENNFKNPKTIPLLMDVEKIITSPFNEQLFDEKAKEFNIIFVGRVAKNKAQHDLIEIANAYRSMDSGFKLYIIGGVTDGQYEHQLRELIHTYNLQEHVILTGKIPNEDLYAYYRSANIFLCMSEHEGFGMPLVESMLFDLPVFAYNSSNIKSTLNGGGILFDEKSPKYIAATINILKNNPSFKTEILNTQRQAREVYYHDLIIKNLIAYLNDFDIECDYTPKVKSKEILYQFEGPFDSSYSLAMLNKNSALAFEKEFPNQVSLFSTEGPGDFEPSSAFLKDNPTIAKMHKSSKKALQCNAVFRNLYPPRVTGMKGELNILNLYAWEESSFPKKHVEAFNQNLDGIIAVSEYTKRVLQTNGVQVPIKIIPNSVDHILSIKTKKVDYKTNKSFKFLHISSCFPRKGVDILLSAYTSTFSMQDDVTLVIKTFPNPHNDVEEQIEQIKKTNQKMPEIILINKDLDDSHIKWLYQNTDTLVAPSRGEGFGLPMAEAMLMNLPVITTGFGGQVDFCKEDNSWLCDYSFAQADTHLDLFDSYWVEPSLEHLKILLKEQVSLTKEQKSLKTKKAYELVSKEFTWSNYATKAQEFLKELKKADVFGEKLKNVAWISSYNTKCGIASYSEFIFDYLDETKFKITKFASYTDEVLDTEKEEGVIRCWNNRYDKENDELISHICNDTFSSVVINFNFGFFSMQNLSAIIEAAYKAKKKITIIFHSIADVTLKGQESSLSWILPSLSHVDNLLVHTIEDLNSLKQLSLTNINLLPHGVQNRYISQDLEQTDSFTIASYGFMLPHKGILELIEAFAILEKKYHNIKLLLVNAIYPAPASQDYADECKASVEKLNLSSKVIFHTEFLSDNETFKLLETSNIIVLPYHNTKESSSASVRHALSTYKPVLCTKQPIFNDVKNIVHFTQGYTPLDIAISLETLIIDKTLLFSKIQKQKEWILGHDWKIISSIFNVYI